MKMLNSTRNLLQNLYKINITVALKYNSKSLLYGTHTFGEFHCRVGQMKPVNDPIYLKFPSLLQFIGPLISYRKPKHSVPANNVLEASHIG